MAHLPALRLADRQRLDVGIVVGDLEPTELAVTTAGKERRVGEIAERALARVEQARESYPLAKLSLRR